MRLIGVICDPALDIDQVRGDMRTTLLLDMRDDEFDAILKRSSKKVSGIE